MIAQQATPSVNGNAMKIGFKGLIFQSAELWTIRLFPEPFSLVILYTPDLNLIRMVNNGISLD